MNRSNKSNDLAIVIVYTLVITTVTTVITYFNPWW